MIIQRLRTLDTDSASFIFLRADEVLRREAKVISSIRASVSSIASIAIGLRELCFLHMFIVCEHSEFNFIILESISKLIHGMNNLINHFMESDYVLETCTRPLTGCGGQVRSGTTAAKLDWII